eukprot:351851-Chlamydomonas_euryale.AAC.7
MWGRRWMKRHGRGRERCVGAAQPGVKVRWEGEGGRDALELPSQGKQRGDGCGGGERLDALELPSQICSGGMMEGNEELNVRALGAIPHARMSAPPIHASPRPCVLTRIVAARAVHGELVLRPPDALQLCQAL